MKQPERMVAQVMDIGDYDDVQLLAAQAGDDYLREVLAHAEIGQYSGRSWSYCGITGWGWPRRARFPRSLGNVYHRMIPSFKPHMEVLPPAQQRLWAALRPAQELGFVLYGGTAIALRLGHRTSVDFDFFSDRSLDKPVMKAAFPFLAGAEGGDLHTLSSAEQQKLIQAASSVRDLCPPPAALPRGC